MKWSNYVAKFHNEIGKMSHGSVQFSTLCANSVLAASPTKQIRRGWSRKAQDERFYKIVSLVLWRIFASFGDKAKI